MVINTFKTAIEISSFLSLWHDHKREAFLALRQRKNRRYSKQFDEAFEWRHDAETILSILGVHYSDDVKTFVAINKKLRKRYGERSVFMLSKYLETIVANCKSTIKIKEV